MNYRTLWYIAAGIIMMVIVGLGGWYLFIQQRISNVEKTSEARGFGESIPTFTGAIGNAVTNVIAGLGISSDTEDQTETGTSPRLVKLSAAPIAGYGFTSTTSTTLLRFMERSSGYLFETNVEEVSPRRLTNTLIPRTHEAYFTKGNAVVAFAAEETGAIKALAGVVGAPTTTSEFLPFTPASLGDGVQSFALSGNDMLTLIESDQGSTLVRSSVQGTGPESLFSSSIAGWRVSWLEEDRIVLAERAATSIPGTAYVLKDGSLVPLARNTPGLTIAADPENEALIIGADNGVLSMAVRATNDAPLEALPLRTVADKCAWAPQQTATSSPIAFCAVPASVPSTQFLNDWYKGLVHTSDNWWRIDAVTGETELLFSLETEGVDIDVERPIVNDDGTYLVFRNARDKSLWRLRIAE